MPYSVADYDIAKGALVLPADGVWNLRAELVGGVVPEERSRVVVRVGDLVLSGTVRRSAVHVEIGEVLVVGGADGWSGPVGVRSYRADNGVRLSTVAGDLARDAGELLGPLGDLELSVLGYGWTRPGGLASHALHELGYPWRVELDGTTRLGPRPAQLIEGAVVGVVDYQPSLRRALLTSPTDQLSIFAPGVQLVGEGLPRVSIAATTISITGSSAHAAVRLS